MFNNIIEILNRCQCRKIEIERQRKKINYQYNYDFFFYKFHYRLKLEGKCIDVVFMNYEINHKNKNKTPDTLNVICVLEWLAKGN